MKYLLLIGDGMADYPLEKLGGKTPLQAADTPNMDELAKKGRCGRFVTIPAGMPRGSAVANLSILGYNPRICFQGRGALEAASMGVKLDPEDVAFRCNIICVRNNKIKSHSGGHITTEEAIELIKTINHKLGTEYIKFHPGISYRHLLVLRGGKFSANVKCTPPHDALDRSITKVLVKAKDKEAEKTANLLNEMIINSQSILEGHPVNLERAKKGKDKANMIWPWSAGKKPLMETFQERFGIKGAVIAAVDLIKGVSIYAGFDVIDVEGATGLYNTNYEGKADACLKALKSYDLVWVHVEASDEASHEGDLDLKIKTIEYFDKRLVGRVLDSIDEDIHIALLPDHFTPVSMRTHVADAVPFLIYDPQKEVDEVSQFDEFSCAKGSLGLLKGDNFIRMFLGK
ncbi:cofactor-independent phosphoglycerate mutase [Candidatus Aerophobetes bacterium]|uniref:Cofactor-independent phosphoglycerate mutase n=1 Tax=Aerophobetes bacterium TaxID=2030807 RepID=A0A523RXE4_UNCAE|nr:MAG: cofactor-independent phosphoglycerate mutase [Candidatus Aerophobetes bacterium]